MDDSGFSLFFGNFLAVFLNEEGEVIFHNVHN